MCRKFESSSLTSGFTDVSCKVCIFIIIRPIRAEYQRLNKFLLYIKAEEFYKQIIIFYDESYFQSFWDRTGPEQFWTPVRQGNSFCGSRNIATSLSEICYHEKIVSEQEVFEEDLWFYGDVPASE
ncbi:MAG: DUF3916 domain-containing protein [Acetatifactor sp.]|nr:DUF3916 domain-containing protein [Acetatifactor sp.]